MGRTVNPEAHAAKADEILAAALRLVCTKGYEGMAIQDLLDALQISKGAFYHYFASKGALLEALVDQLLDEAVRALAPLALDPHAEAPEALSRFFLALGDFKAGQKSFILAVLPVWYSDDNAIVREKVRAAFAGRLRPLVAAIIRRGCDAGSFQVASPEQTARVVLELTQDLSDALARQLLDATGGASAVAEAMAAIVAATAEAIERVLAAPKGTIRLADPGLIDTWLAKPEGRAE
jgi:AcrR family transcriptional regulator